MKTELGKAAGMPTLLNQSDSTHEKEEDGGSLLAGHALGA